MKKYMILNEPRKHDCMPEFRITPDNQMELVEEMKLTKI